MGMSRKTKLHPATVEAYWRMVRLFCDWHMAHYGHAPDMASLHDDTIDRYLRWCALRVGASAFRKRRAALRWARATRAHEKEQK
jgi:hypothetical protein